MMTAEQIYRKLFPAGEPLETLSQSFRDGLAAIAKETGQARAGGDAHDVVARIVKLLASYEMAWYDVEYHGTLRDGYGVGPGTRTTSRGCPDSVGAGSRALFFYIRGHKKLCVTTG